MMMKQIWLCMIVIGMSVFVCGVPSALATIDLLNGRLIVRGSYKEQMFIRKDYPSDEKRFHKSKVDYWRSVLLFDGLLKLKDDGDFTLNFFSGYRYWYEKTPAVDSSFKRGIARKDYGDYIRPTTEEMITEMYFDIIKGPLQFKIGKQIVVWGETNIRQTADIINPLDVRFGSPGTEKWEDIKIALWMIRGFYLTDLPGHLSFEFIFNPGDYQIARAPIESTHYGPHRATTSFNPKKGPGIYHWIQQKALDDAPGWHLKKNWEAGFKVRGYTWDIDWSFFYFNSRTDEPTADAGRLLEWSLAYINEGVRSRNTGSKIRPKGPDIKVFNFKRFDVFGATFQTRFADFPISEWRLELFFENGRPYNRGIRSNPSAIYDEVRRDTVGFGLEARDYFSIPYFTRNWFQNKKGTYSVTLFYEKILKHERDLIVRGGRGHRPGDSSAIEIAYSVSQFWDQSRWFGMVTGTYNPIGKYFICPIIGYAPDNHWRFEGGIPIYGSSASSNKGLYDRDSLLLRIRYEF